MALTQSEDLALGTPAPGFNLLATTGDHVSLQDYQGVKGLVVLFICNHCPYVIHIAPALAELAKAYQAKGIEFVAINSNDTRAYPADSFENMQKEVAQRGYSFAYLLDDTQEVAKAYRAVCTPDIYVFDGDLNLFYHGQFDDTRPHRIASGNYDSSGTPAHGADLQYALDKLLAEEHYDRNVYPCMGCNIKWMP